MKHAHWKLLYVCTSIIILLKALQPILSNASVTDSDWESYFTAQNGYSVPTTVRVKEDDSSVYCYCTSSDYPWIYIKIYGCDDYNKANAENCTGWYQSPNFGYSKPVYLNGSYDSRFYSNSVYELGHDFAYLITMTDDYGGHASGCWSPDSVY